MGKVEAFPSPYMEVNIRLKTERSANVNRGKISRAVLDGQN
jgi:hypothetical protein